MERIFTAAEMKACDTYTIEELGVPSASLMERAALSCALEAERLFRLRTGDGSYGKKPDPVLVACGSGNNGGDGYACARILTLRGIPTAIYDAGNPDHFTSETRRQREICENIGIPHDEDPDFEKASVIVDALLGTGLSRPVAGHYAEVIEKINRSGVPVVSVDIPSGISADTGQVLGCAVKAHSTVTMQRLKRGLVLYPGAFYAGTVIRAEIGVSTAASDCTAYMLQDEDVQPLLPARRKDGNKGTFGKVLVTAGSYNMAGASYLAALAAIRTGCGMVRILTADENREILQELLPEAMLATYRTPEEAKEELLKWKSWADVIAIGPGLGLTDSSKVLVKTALSDTDCPLVLDADGLNIISSDPDILNGREHLYITPHIGEMSRLTGIPSGEIKADPVKAACAFTCAHHCTVVLKDARTVISTPYGPVFFNRTGNSGMAAAGSGDVLTGILAGLLAQRADPVTAPALAVYLHGKAGDFAAKKYGERFMKARDIIECLKEAMEEGQKQ